MNQKAGSIVAGSTFLLAGVLFIIVGARSGKAVFFALGAAFAAISMSFLGKAKSMKE